MSHSLSYLTDFSIIFSLLLLKILLNNLTTIQHWLNSHNYQCLLTSLQANHSEIGHHIDVEVYGPFQWQGISFLRQNAGIGDSISCPWTSFSPLLHLLSYQARSTWKNLLQAVSGFFYFILDSTCLRWIQCFQLAQHFAQPDRLL